MDEFTEYDTGGVCALDRGDFERLVIATLDDDDARDNLAKGTQGAKARLERIFHKADLDGDGAIDFNEFVAYRTAEASAASLAAARRPAGERKRSMGGIDALDSAVDVLGSLDLINRADALLQAEGIASTDDDGDDTENDGDLTLRTLLDRQAKQRSEARWLAARRVVEEQQNRESVARVALEAQRRNDEEVRRDEDEYSELIRAAAEEASLAAGAADHAAALDASALRAAERQFRGCDRRREGSLDFERFGSWVRKLFRAQGRPLLPLFLMGLFTEADVDGSQTIDFNEWLWARRRALQHLDELARAEEEEKAAATAQPAIVPRQLTFVESAYGHHGAGQKRRGSAAAPPAAADPWTTPGVSGKEERISSATDPRAIRAAFAQYDRDRSGFIDHKELRAALRHMGYDVDEAAAKEVLKAYDDTPDGKMDEREFAKMVADLLAGGLGRRGR